MAIDRGICVVADVERWTRPPVSYSASTKPTLTQVEDDIDDAIDEIYAELDGCGIIVPIIETATKRIVAQANAVMAAYKIVTSLHQSVEPNETPYSKILKDEYLRLMELIKTKMIFTGTAIDGDRPVIPKDNGLWSKMSDIWDTSTEDDTARGALFTISKEF